VLTIALVTVTTTGVAFASDKTDRKRAERALLTLTEIPDGWRERSSDTKVGDDIRRGLSVCDRYQATIEAGRKLPRATVGFVESGQDASIDNSVVVYPSVTKARAAFKVFAADLTVRCFEQSTPRFLEESVNEGVDVGDASAGHTATTELGDERTSVQTEVDLTGNGVSISLFLDFAVYRVEKNLVLFSFGNTGEPLPDQEGFASLVVGRLQGTDAGGSSQSTDKVPLGTPITLNLEATDASTFDSVAVPGSRVTVYAYQQPVATEGPQPADAQEPANFVWSAVDVELCVGPSTTRRLSISSRAWTLRFADNTQVSPSSTGYSNFPEPGFPFGDAELGANECVRGWITYAVPGEGRPATVAFSNVRGAPASWSVG